MSRAAFNARFNAGCDGAQANAASTRDMSSSRLGARRRRNATKMAFSLAGRRASARDVEQDREIFSDLFEQIGGSSG
jgi:hypothetical protein